LGNSAAERYWVHVSGLKHGDYEENVRNIRNVTATLSAKELY